MISPDLAIGRAASFAYTVGARIQVSSQSEGSVSGQSHKQLVEATTLLQDGSAMYEDHDLWPVKCPRCAHGFTETIGRIKSRLVSSCPRCSSDFAHSAEQFLFALSEAREGRHNPWWEILSAGPAE
jgi:predicted Zn-ribbon and HTH transcriptional regulator